MEEIKLNVTPLCDMHILERMSDLETCMAYVKGFEEALEITDKSYYGFSEVRSKISSAVDTMKLLYEINKAINDARDKLEKEN